MIAGSTCEPTRMETGTIISSLYRSVPRPSEIGSLAGGLRRRQQPPHLRRRAPVPRCLLGRPTASARRPGRSAATRPQPQREQPPHESKRGVRVTRGDELLHLVERREVARLSSGRQLVADAGQSPTSTSPPRGVVSSSLLIESSTKHTPPEATPLPRCRPSPSGRSGSETQTAAVSRC